MTSLEMLCGATRPFQGLQNSPLLIFRARSSRQPCCDVDAYFCIFSTYRLALGVSKDRLGYDMKYVFSKCILSWMILNVLIRRKPAWTDRVLYMAPPDVKVAQVAYRSHPEITMSDHLPVSADFDISVRAHGVHQRVLEC